MQAGAVTSACHSGVKTVPEIILYTKPNCPYCAAAMRLLAGKGAAYTEIVASSDPAKKQEMIEKSEGRRTFPQIFIDGLHVGGSDDLKALDQRGALDPLLIMKDGAQ